MQQQAKKQLRKEIRQRLKNLEDGNEKSQKLAKRLMNISDFRESKAIGVYLAMPTHEVSTREILKQLFDWNKSVYVPKVVGPNAEDMRMLQIMSMDEIESFPLNNWQIPEPDEVLSTSKPRPDALETLDIDTILVPGLGFDAKRRRLGHGKGYYDSFLSRLSIKYSTLEKPRPKLIVRRSELNSKV